MLRELLVDVEVLSTSGDLSVEIDNLEFDSREAKPGTLFFAMRGTQTDGHRFIGAAVGLGLHFIHRAVDEHNDVSVLFDGA